MSTESPLREAQQRFAAAVAFRATGRITRPLTEACGYTCLRDITAPADMPPYPRAIVEGFVVNASETRDASEAAPTSFRIAGRVLPGDSECAAPRRGEAIEVATGSIVPSGPVAIVRMWEAERNGDSIVIKRPFPPQFFIEQQGCDIKQGSVVVAAGTRLTPWNLGVLASLGVTDVELARPPAVVLFSSGNEVIAHTEPLRPGAIRDSNSVMLSAAVAEAGGIPRFAGIMRDDFDAFVARLKQVLAENDMVVISGGTAAGGRDFVSDLIRAVGQLVVDGVPMRSGRPLIMGVSDGKPIVGVAGHPPEALRGFHLFGVAAINRLLGRELPLPEDSPAK